MTKVYYRNGKIMFAKDGRTEESGLTSRHYRMSTSGKLLGTHLYVDEINQQIKKLLKGTEPEPSIHKSETDVVRLIEKYTYMMHTGELKSNKGKLYRPASIASYTNAASRLYKFCKESRRTIDLQKVDRERWRSFFTAFDNWMAKSMKLKSRYEIMNMVAIMIKYWHVEKGYAFYPMPRVEKTEKPIVVIPPELIRNIVNDTRHEGNMVWEVISTILVTTLRIGDVMTLSPKDLIDDGKTMTINKELSKTGRCTMPIPPRLAGIYRKNIARTGQVWSQPIDKQTIYDKMRDIIKGYDGMDAEITITVEGKQETKPLWEYVTPHMLRKSAITAMIYYEVDHVHVRHASGHSHSSKAFWRYVQVVDSRFNSDISRAHSVMLGSVG